MCEPHSMPHLLVGRSRHHFVVAAKRPQITLLLWMSIPMACVELVPINARADASIGTLNAPPYVQFPAELRLARRRLTYPDAREAMSAQSQNWKFLGDARQAIDLVCVAEHRGHFELSIFSEISTASSTSMPRKATDHVCLAEYRGHFQISIFSAISMASSRCQGTHGAFDLRVTEQELHGSKVTRPPVDQHGFGTPQ